MKWSNRQEAIVRCFFLLFFCWSAVLLFYVHGISYWPFPSSFHFLPPFRESCSLLLICSSYYCANSTCRSLLILLWVCNREYTRESRSFEPRCKCLFPVSLHSTSHEASPSPLLPQLRLCAFVSLFVGLCWIKATESMFVLLSFPY